MARVKHSIASPWTKKEKVASFDPLTYTDGSGPSQGRLRSDYMTCHFPPNSARSFPLSIPKRDASRHDAVVSKTGKGLYLRGAIAPPWIPISTCAITTSEAPAPIGPRRRVCGPRVQPTRGFPWSNPTPSLHRRPSWSSPLLNERLPCHPPHQLLAPAGFWVLVNPRCGW